MRNKDNAEFTCSWKNGIIWGVIALAAAMLAHVGLWYFLMWYQDPDIFQNDVCILALVFTILGALFPLGFGLFSYQGYRRIAAVHHTDLNGVSYDRYGRPWLVPLILLLALELVWLIIALVILSAGMELSWQIPIERVVLGNFLKASAIAAAIDAILYVLGVILFKPNQVRDAHIRTPR